MPAADLDVLQRQPALQDVERPLLLAVAAFTAFEGAVVLPPSAAGTTSTWCASLWSLLPLLGGVRGTADMVPAAGPPAPDRDPTASQANRSHRRGTARVQPVAGVPGAGQQAGCACTAASAPHPALDL